MQARHWIIGGVAFLLLAGAFVLGSHVHNAPTPDSASQAQGSLSAMLNRTIEAAGGNSGAQNAPAAPVANLAGPAAARAPAAGAAGFGFADVEALAHDRAQKSYEPGSAKLPAAIAHLTYDQYQSIRFRARRCHVAQPVPVRGAVLPSRFQF